MTNAGDRQMLEDGSARPPWTRGAAEKDTQSAAAPEPPGEASGASADLRAFHERVLERQRGGCFEATPGAAAFEQLVELTRDGAALLDPEGHVVYCNAALAALLSLGRGEVAGRKFADLVEPSYLAAFAEVVARASEGTGRADLVLVSPAAEQLTLVAVTARAWEGGHLLVAHDVTVGRHLAYLRAQLDAERLRREQLQDRIRELEERLAGAR